MMDLNLHRESRINVLGLVAAICLFDDGGILFYQYLLVQIYFFPKNHPKCVIILPETTDTKSKR